MDWLRSLPVKARDKCVVRLERLAELGHELRRPEADFLNRHEAIKVLNAEHADLLKLSPSERLLLAQDLWDSLCPENIPLTDWQKTELDRRKAAYEANPASGHSWEEVQRRIIEN